VVHFAGGGASAKNVGMIVNGDTAIQFTDFFLECSMIVTSKIGLEVGGNVGGLGAVCGDILGNNVDMQIDQGVVSVPNSQIMLGSNLYLDQTTGGKNDNLYITDPGGPNSLLFTSGTWMASAVSSCIEFAPNVTWRVHLSGGTLYNCAAAGIYGNSANVTMDITGMLIDYTTNYGINNPLATIKKCAVTFGSHVLPANIFGTVGNSC
jgi:hypothetical protein